MQQPLVIVAPTGEPVSLAEAKLHLRRDDVTTDDGLITAQIGAAREWAEQFTGRSLAPQTLEVAFDAFPQPGAAIELPGAPIRSVLSITYDDVNGAAQPFAGYVFDKYAGRLLAASLSQWPSGARYYASAVRVRYTAGYSLPADNPQTFPLPQAIRAALLLLLGDLYEHRQSSTPDRVESLPFGAEALLRPYRINMGV